MKYSSKISSLFGGALLVLFAGSGHADDIDIYYTTGSLTPDSEPLVMLSLDWRPNLVAPADCSAGQCDVLIDEGYLAPSASYTFFDILRAVLRKVMDPLEGVKVGLMINHDYKNNCAGSELPGCSNGGFIALGRSSWVMAMVQRPLFMPTWTRSRCPWVMRATRTRVKSCSSSCTATCPARGFTTGT
jgi:hypothetical protein